MNGSSFRSPLSSVLVALAIVSAIAPCAGVATMLVL